MILSGGTSDVKVETFTTRRMLALYADLTEPAIVLWNNDGLIGMIPIERVQNDLKQREDMKRAGRPVPARLVYHWGDVKEISWTEAADLLVAVEDTDQQP